MWWQRVKQSGLIVMGGIVLALGLVFGTFLLLIGVVVLVVAAVILRFRLGRSSFDVTVTRERPGPHDGELLEGEFEVVQKPSDDIKDARPSLRK